MKKTIIPVLLIGVLFVPVFSQANYYTAKFFSFVNPDIPIASDSIRVAVKGYIRYGAIIDSSLSISGNDILINYSVTDSLQPNNYIIDKNKFIGILSPGDYRIITTTVCKRTRGVPPIVDKLECDTVHFTVLPATGKPPKIVGFKQVTGYPGVGGDDFIVNSYCYWNGDTLSVAVGFGDGGTCDYTAHLSMRADTIIIDLTDTVFTSYALVSTFLCVTSITPVNPGNYPIKITNKLLHFGYSKSNLETLNTDNTHEGIGLSLKKPGTPEFTVFLNNKISFYELFSPFLDTLKVFSLQPNPHFKVNGTHSIFIGYPQYESLSKHWDRIDFWDSTYHKSDWLYSSLQATDHLSYDTIGRGNGTVFRINYSSDINDTVLSYAHRTISPPLSSQSPNPGLSFFASFNDPNTGTTNPLVNKTKKKQSLNNLRLVYSGQKVHISFQASSLQPDVKISIVDIYGRVVSRPEYMAPAATGSLVSVIWDKRDTKGRNVAKGIYFALITYGNRHYSVKVNITE